MLRRAANKSDSIFLYLAGAIFAPVFFGRAIILSFLPKDQHCVADNPKPSFVRIADGWEIFNGKEGI